MMYGENYSKMSAEDKKYQAMHDCQALVDAAEVKMDKARYKAAMAAAKEKMEALKYVAMNPGEMGKMNYPDYSKARRSQSSKNMMSGAGYA